MRRLSYPMFAVLLASWAMLGSGCAGAHQKLDPVALNPGRYTVLLENEHVRVLEMRDKPGDVTAMHSHPGNVVYIFSPAQRRFTFPDGTTKVADVKAGQVLWSDGGAHAEKNVGKTDTHALVIEIKKQSKWPN